MGTAKEIRGPYWKGDETCSPLPDEEEMDRAIEFTFPASDPPSWTTPGKRRKRDGDREMA